MMVDVHHAHPAQGRQPKEFTDMSTIDLFELSETDWEAHITGGITPRLMTAQDLHLNAATVSPPTFAAVIESRVRPEQR